MVDPEPSGGLILAGLVVQVREELQKCWRTEGVNHYEVCHPLTEKYLDLLRTNRVSKPSAREDTGARGWGLTQRFKSGRLRDSASLTTRHKLVSCIVYQSFHFSRGLDRRERSLVGWTDRPRPAATRPSHAPPLRRCPLRLHPA